MDQPSLEINTKKRKQTKPAQSTKRVKKTAVVLPYESILSRSPAGILTGNHGVAFHIHSFLDMPTLLAIFATCKAARFHQTSGVTWQALLVGHGLEVPPVLKKPLTTTKLVTRFTKTPTIATRAVYKAIKDSVSADKMSYDDHQFAKMAPTKLDAKIRTQEETIYTEELKIEELKKKLATAESRLDWLTREKSHMERMRPVSIIFDQAKKASKHLNKVLASRRKPRVKKSQVKESSNPFAGFAFDPLVNAVALVNATANVVGDIIDLTSVWLYICSVYNRYTY